MGLKHNLLWIPLIFMFVIAMFSLAGLGEGELGTGYVYNSDTETYYYIYTGEPVMYTANLTGLGYPSLFGAKTVSSVDYVYWNNNSFQFLTGTGYYLYHTSDGNSTGDTPVLWKEIDDKITSLNNVGNDRILSVVADFTSSYGLIMLFVALMIAIGLLGLNFFGTGENETSTQTIIMGAGFLAVWGICSAISLSLLGDIPLGLGSIFYFGLTFAFVIGLIMNIGGK